MSRLTQLLFSGVILAASMLVATAEQTPKSRQVIPLWPTSVPGQKEAKAAAAVSSNQHKGVTRLSKVTNPNLTVFPANQATKNGAAVIIFPGGGYNILAIDLEGYEVARWLSELGYTAFVLQYRVPKQKTGALQDAQRAIRVVRSSAQQWNVKTDQIGVIGFSAGGSLAARISTRFQEPLYPVIDESDKISARPDFSMLIYPAYLDQGKGRSLTPELKIGPSTPPMFFFVAGDDHFVNSSLVMGSALTKKKVPYALHIVPKGGHGFGLRKGNPAAETWPGLCATWMQRTLSNQSK